MIKVFDLHKSFITKAGEYPVLKGVNLRVAPGEFLAITGRSGSGKSTLLYQLGLLDVPNSGSIVIDGVETRKLSEEGRINMRLSELGYVFQDYALLPSLTAAENIFVPLLMAGYSTSAATKLALAAMEKLELADKRDNLPGTLSGGQQQRVSIARAIANTPKVLFADEPTANLDSETSKVVLQAFLELHRGGQTIVMVTHEPEYAALADRVVVLSDGMIKE